MRAEAFDTVVPVRARLADLLLSFEHAGAAREHFVDTREEEEETELAWRLREAAMAIDGKAIHI